MKKTIYIISIIFIGSQLLVSCNSSNNTLSQFSKRKYLKKYKPSQRVKNDVINNYYAEQKEEGKALYSSKEIKPKYFVLDEIDSPISIPLNEEFSEQNIKIIKSSGNTVEINRTSIKPYEYYLRNFKVKTEELEVVEDDRKKNSLALWSFFFSMLSVGSIILTLVTFILFSNWNYALLLSSLFLAIGGVILGTVSLGRIKHNRKKYMRKGLAFAGFILGTILTIAIASLMLFFSLEDARIGS